MRRRDNTTAIIVTVVVGLLLAITIGATAIFSSGFTNWDVSTWTWSFAPAQSEETQEEQAEDATEETTTVSSALRLAKNNSILIVEELDKEDLSFYWHFDFENDGGFFSSFGTNAPYFEEDDRLICHFDVIPSELISSALFAGSFTIITDTFYAVENGGTALFSGMHEYFIENVSERKGKVLDGHISLTGVAVDDTYEGDYTFIFDFYATLPTLTKEGYIFAGWYTDEKCTEEYDKSYVYEDTPTLYAGWSVPVSVTFIDSETEYEDIIPVPFNSALSEDQFPKLQREKYTLVGWQYEDGTMYDGQLISGKTSLTAVWEETKYTVTFYVNGNVYKTVKLLEGATFQEALDVIGFDKSVVYNIKTVDENVELDLNNITSDITATIDAGAVNQKAFVDNSYIIALVIAGLVIILTVGVVLQIKKRK